MRDKLKEQIKYRFRHILDPSNRNDFDSTYVKAALFDPAEAILIPTDVFPIQDYLMSIARSNVESHSRSGSIASQPGPSYRERVLARRRQEAQKHCDQNDVEDTAKAAVSAD